MLNPRPRMSHVSCTDVEAAVCVVLHIAREGHVLTSRMAEIERAYRKQHLFQNAKAKGASKSWLCDIAGADICFVVS